MACSLFEGSLTDLCKGFQRDPALPTPQSWEGLGKHKGRKRAAAFLKDNFGILLPNYRHWEKIGDYFKVRDCIVHADGDVSNMQPDQAADIRQKVKHYSFLEIVITHGRLGFGPKFVAAAIDDMAGIWPALHHACFENEVVGPHYWP